MRSPFFFAAAIALAAPSAFAADPQAESLYDSAIALMRQGRFADACPKLEASERLEPKSGTSIVLGTCYREIHRTASAWAEFKEAAQLARNEKRAEYQTKAEHFAAEIEPDLSKLTISVISPAPSLEITIDGKPLGAGSLDVPFAIDPGDHEIVAHAPSRVSWSAHVTLGAAHDAKTVSIPALAIEPSASASANATPIAPPPNVPAPSDTTPPASAKGGAPTWAFVAGGAGIVLAGVGVGFFVASRSATSDFSSHCPSNAGGTPVCDGIGDHWTLSQGNDGRAAIQRDNGLAIAFAGAGGVSLAAAVYGILSAPKEAKVAWTALPMVTPTMGGATLRATF